MTLHETTFGYLKPTDAELATMTEMRMAFADLADAVERLLPGGRDKDYVIRLIRTAGMWANVTITRAADGDPRS